MIGVVVTGVAGRMGSTIARLVEEDSQLTLVGATEAPGHPWVGGDLRGFLGVGEGVKVTSSLDEAITGETRVVIDFTLPQATLAHLETAVKEGVAMVIGTTGITGKDLERARSLASRIPCVWAPNMSVGVNLLFKLVGEVARILGEDYDVEIVEIHHRFKKDAPSGTAVRLAEKVAQALGRDLDQVGVYGRHGMVGERNREEIGVMALRGGDVVGEHTVIFAALGERVELTHRAHSRETFARGAIRAAKWVVDMAPGLYDMAQVLGL
ncbi:MAG: 4-hydroxy-tetrahydrodipicolinate reductase [Aquificota bacterium]|nr:MAG: 4-hydroxy-tetrahydrodipicolinate reductase [Aquificota bacterium]